MDKYSEYNFYIDSIKVLIPELNKDGDLVYVDKECEIIKEIADETVITYAQLKDAFNFFIDELKNDLISLYEKTE